MPKYKIPFTNIFISYGKVEVIQNVVVKKVEVPTIPGRTSIPNVDNSFITTLETQLKVVQPGFNFEVIPIIRKLVLVNHDVSQALNNIVELGNTGHKINFDPRVDAATVDKMRIHLERKRRQWAEGVSGMGGLVNKFISQIIIGGALSVETVPNMDLTGVDKVVLINPETIRFAFDVPKGKYLPYQAVQNNFLINSRTNSTDGFVKLNPQTFNYFAVNGDQEIPYGNPPYLAALDPIATQKIMNDNIKFIVEQVGIMGFLEMLLSKPAQNDNESETAYKNRLNNLLLDTKKRLQEGLRDGVSVGFKEDHEFNFHSTTKSVQGLSEIYQQNELALFSGLKTDPSLAGRSYGTSETQINVVFTKLISQLQNIQEIVATQLEFIYTMELRLSGFQFETLTVKFKPSTAADDLKMQQAREIKIRNLNALYDQGIISQEQYADEMNYDEPDQAKPRVTRDKDVMAPAAQKTDREKKKDASNRKSTDKKKRSSATKNGELEDAEEYELN